MYIGFFKVKSLGFDKQGQFLNFKAYFKDN